MCLWGPAYLMAFWWNLCWFSPIRGLEHDLRNQRERLSYTSVSLICPKLKLNPYRIVSESSQMTSSRFPQGFEANCGVESTSKVTPGLNTISRFCVLDEWVVLSYMIMPFFPLSRLSREFFCFFLFFGFMYGFHLVENWHRSYDARPSIIIQREWKRKKEGRFFLCKSQMDEDYYLVHS